MKKMLQDDEKLAAEIEAKVRENAGALYAKSAVSPNASPAKPLETESKDGAVEGAAQASQENGAQEDSAKAKPRVNPNVDIDITVDD